MITQDQVIELLSSYAYEPLMVYSFIIAILAASSFGLPIPEEITLVSAGIIGYFALNPDLYPPPEEGLTPINVWILAAVCLFSVFLSDLLMYWIGRLGGHKIRKSARLSKFVTGPLYTNAVTLTQKYGAWMAGLFRFTPGLRFPGHIACGMLGVSHWKFWLSDGTAAALSVPTQVLLIAHYGEEILTYIKQFKVIIVVLALIGILGFVIYRFYSKYTLHSKMKA